MPRIVHVTQPADGGVAAYVVRVAADQIARGWDVTVFCAPPLEAAVRAVGAESRVWAARRGPGTGTLVDARRLGSRLAATGPDVVHLHSSSAGLAGRLVLRGRTPTLFSPHGWSWLALNGYAASAARKWERAASRWTDYTVCVSEAERAAGEAAGVRGRLVVVRNGVDLTRFAAVDESDRAEARSMLGLADGPLVVCVGRWARQKGQDLLLAGWPKVRQAFPGATLALVGAGTTSALESVAAADGIVAVEDQREVRPWYAAADVAVFPSRWEGLSLALLEAAAVGSSIVATDVAGVREVLGDGERGAVVPTDTSAILAAVAARLGDPALRARERVATARFARDHLDERPSYDALADLVLTCAVRKS